MREESVEIEVSGLKLRGKIFFAEEPKSLAFLFLHGWTGPPNELAGEFMASHGYTSMTFSLSGHNDSDGKIEDQTISKSLQEVLAAYDFFKNHLPKDTKIGAAGNSYGGYLSIILSAERPVQCLSLRVPSNYIDDDFEKTRLGRGAENPEVFRWRHKVLETNVTSALRAFHRFGGSVQIIEAELDDMVPHQSIQNYLDAIKDKSKLDYHFMKGWPHSIGDSIERNEQFQQMLLKWAKTVAK